MPRIPPDFLTCTFYLYRSKKAAKRGEGYGGTGFVVASQGDFRNGFGPATYGVTNYHVAVKGGYSVVRINRLRGEPQILEFDPSEWQFIPNGDDVAAVELPVDIKVHAIRAVPTSLFATKDHIATHQIGPGEDVFMIGRFMNHDGGRINQPAARFGNISVMPAPVRQENGQFRDYYCIDLHSRTGYSGSPIFVYRTFGQDLTGQDIAKANSRSASAGRGTIHAPSHFQIEYRAVFSLLGIHCGQFPEEWEIKIKEQKKSKKKAVVSSNWDMHVEGFSGMAIASPAWHILELLDLPYFARGKKLSYEALLKLRPEILKAYPKQEATR